MRTITTLFLLLPLISFAQGEKQQFIGKGLLRAQGAFCGGIMFNQNDYNIYLDGDLEYYVDNRISIRSESYFLLGSAGGSDDAAFRQNHSNLVGAMYHFKTKGQFDPYVGLQPGVTYAQRYFIFPIPGELVVGINPNPTISPIFGISAGFNFYAKKYVHLFGRVLFTTGRHMDYYGSASLNEVKLSFGLGWNLWALKRK